MLWGRLSSRRGNRQVITGTALAQVIIPVLALILAYAPFDAFDLTLLFYPIFFLIGASSAGTFIGFKSYLLDMAPEDRRPTYIGINNTVMGVAALFPALGGVMADFVNLRGVFVVSGLLVAGGGLLSLRLRQLRSEE